MLAIPRVGPNKPVVWLVATILAPTTAAPEGSTMVPVIVAVVYLRKGRQAQK